MKKMLGGLAMVALVVGCASTPVTVITNPFPAKAVRGTKGMVASVQPLATDAGVAAFARGGNAIDAAVAVAVTLGVVDGHNSGLGGGCFMLVHTADGRNLAFDGREMAPGAATRDMYIRDGKGDTKLSQTGPLASGVPGSVAVYEKALAMAGKGKLSDALLPAAELAEKGFAIDSRYARKLKDTAKKISMFPGTAAVLLKADGTPYKEAETLRQADLAKTYRAIAAGGSNYYYKGEYAQKVGQWMAANGGILTAGDYANYVVKMREPLVTTYRGYTLVGFPPPSSGGVHVAQILNIMENFDIKKLEAENPAARIHVIAEAMKLAFADRAYWLGDPDFVQVPKGLVDKGYAKELAGKIKMERVTEVPKQGAPPGMGNFSMVPADEKMEVSFYESESLSKHTTHIAAADADGNWVAITTTVNTAFGSKVIIPGTGIILNNQMDDFSIQPGVANAFKLVGSDNNAVAARKRPLSSMSPTVVLKDGKPVMTMGAAGGPTIITQVLLAISNVVDLGDSLPRALERPRFHQQWSPDELQIEITHSLPVLMDLEDRGHVLRIVTPKGATNGIMEMEDGTFLGVSEPRVPGKAGGWSGK